MMDNEGSGEEEDFAEVDENGESKESEREKDLKREFERRGSMVKEELDSLSSVARTLEASRAMNTAQSLSNEVAEDVYRASPRAVDLLEELQSELRRTAGGFSGVAELQGATYYELDNIEESGSVKNLKEALTGFDDQLRKMERVFGGYLADELAAMEDSFQQRADMGQGYEWQEESEKVRRIRDAIVEYTTEARKALQHSLATLEEMLHGYMRIRDEYVEEKNTKII